MVVKINNKPIKVEQEKEVAFSKAYIASHFMFSTFALYMLDKMAYMMFYTHPFPRLHTIIEKVMLWASCLINF